MDEVAKGARHSLGASAAVSSAAAASRRVGSDRLRRFRSDLGSQRPTTITSTDSLQNPRGSSARPVEAGRDVDSSDRGGVEPADPNNTVEGALLQGDDEDDALAPPPRLLVRAQLPLPELEFPEFVRRHVGFVAEEARAAGLGTLFGDEGLSAAAMAAAAAAVSGLEQGQEAENDGNMTPPPPPPATDDGGWSGGAPGEGGGVAVELLGRVLEKMSARRKHYLSGWREGQDHRALEARLAEQIVTLAEGSVRELDTRLVHLERRRQMWGERQRQRRSTCASSPPNTHSPPQCATRLCVYPCAAAAAHCNVCVWVGRTGRHTAHPNGGCGVRGT
jgi:hypothetical protein